ncbi:hypothetical protein [Luteibacter yeojuensis]|uniref:Sel1 repeat-containing protein n=1 Tax=Luteibacter yeojuensis TaxID=345309 RepID=A0A7X5TQS9_9GAMM|nr:hypothetical protein [Luteibacter yeojuensis]NID15797.1 hypothetical protein [Luteibacter yeojuensis]
MRRGAIPATCLILFFLALSPSAASASAAGSATVEIAGHGLLNPALPLERRRQLADRLLFSALAGNAASQELAGTLYLQGRSRQGNVLPRDISRARRLLSAAAHRGRRHAMQRLAELELGDGHAYEAALWTRVEHELYGPASPRMEPARPDADGGAGPDARLDTEVALKVLAIREAIGIDASPPW